MKELAHTLEAGKGQERMPLDLIVEEQPEHSRPRRSHLRTLSHDEGHGGNAEPIRRQVLGVDTLKPMLTL